MGGFRGVTMWSDSILSTRGLKIRCFGQPAEGQVSAASELLSPLASLAGYSERRGAIGCRAEWQSAGEAMSRDLSLAMVSL
jgi:hypothetical protein